MNKQKDPLKSHEFQFSPRGKSDRSYEWSSLANPITNRYLDQLMTCGMDIPLNRLLAWVVEYNQGDLLLIAAQLGELGALVPSLESSSLWLLQRLKDFLSLYPP